MPKKIFDALLSLGYNTGIGCKEPDFCIETSRAFKVLVQYLKTNDPAQFKLFIREMLDTNKADDEIIYGLMSRRHAEVAFMLGGDWVKTAQEWASHSPKQRNQNIAEAEAEKAALKSMAEGQ